MTSNVKSFELHILAPPSKSEERTPQNQIWVRDRRRKVEQKIEKGVSNNHLNPSRQAVSRVRDRGWKSEQKKEKEIVMRPLEPEWASSLVRFVIRLPGASKKK